MRFFAMLRMTIEVQCHSEELRDEESVPLLGIADSSPSTAFRVRMTEFFVFFVAILFEIFFYLVYNSSIKKIRRGRWD